MTNSYWLRPRDGDAEDGDDGYEGPQPAPIDPREAKVAELVAAISRFERIEKAVLVRTRAGGVLQYRDRVVYTFGLHSRHPLTLRSDDVPAVSVTYRTDPTVGNSECFTLPFASEVWLEPRRFVAQFVPKSQECDVDCMMPRGVTELHIGHRVVRFRNGWRVRPE